MRYFLSFVLLFLLAGCNEDGFYSNRSQPYIGGGNGGHKAAQNSDIKLIGGSKKEDVETARIKAEAEKEIARINMEKEVLIQKLKGATEVEKAGISKEIAEKQAEAARQKAVIDKDIAIKHDQTQRQIAQSSHEMQKWIILVAGLFLLGLIIFIFYNSSRNRKERLKMHKDRLDQELYLKEQEMRVKIAERVLDTIASGKLNPEQENRLIDNMAGSSNLLPDRSEKE
ncbi:MAG: hypothetical protein B5M52_02035 [Helicobacteraceae bacterium 4484_230]|nr:MAG: hypothetical protein B5M52_02035 [Helicobacteraceae bacterium 4484_230]